MTRQEENYIECCLSNDLNAIKTLFKHNVDVTVSEYWGYRIAATKGYIELLEFLFSINSDHEQLNKSYILAWAATSGQLDSVRFLIGLSDVYKDDSSALQWTASAGNLAMLEILLNYCVYFDWIFVSAAKSGHV